MFFRKEELSKQKIFPVIKKSLKDTKDISDKIKTITESVHFQLEERYKISENIILSELQLSILKSERFRILIILSLIILAFIHFFSFKLFAPERIIQFIGGESSLYWYFFLLIFYLFYEGIVYLRITHYIKNKLQVPNLLRYIHSFMEISMPTIFLYILGTHMQTPESLIFLPYLFYYFLIILTILRLDIFLCIFTGIIAFLQYLLLAIYFMNIFPHKEGVPIYFYSIDFYINHSVSYIVAGIIAGILAKTIKENIKKSAHILEDRNEILEVFGQYVSPEVVNKLLNQKQLDITEKRKVTIMFLDIRNFTRFSESKDPVEVIQFLNLLFGNMVDIINEYHGIVNKFLGDGFMAIFGAPIESKEAPWNALQSALKILKITEELKKKYKTLKTHDWELKIGIGIHTGEAITGNIGSKTRKEYTVIGDTVNTASRIEQLNKKFGSQLLISEETLREIQIHNHSISILDSKKVLVKGKQKPIKVYRVY